MFYSWYRIKWRRNQLWNCTHFRHPTHEELALRCCPNYHHGSKEFLTCHKRFLNKREAQTSKSIRNLSSSSKATCPASFCNKIINNNNDNDLEVAHVHPQSGSLSTWFLMELEFGNVGFRGKGKTGVPREKPLGAKERTNNKLNPHMALMPGFEPRPHWWEASALTTTPSLAH